jgi:hypothetical protein
MTSTAAWSERPCSAHRERQVQNEMAWPDDGADPVPLPGIFPERRGQQIALAPGLILQSPLVSPGERREVAVKAGEHAGPGPVEPVQVGQASPQPLPDVMALADQYGLQSGQPDWLPGLISPYHLTPPPGA